MSRRRRLGGQPGVRLGGDVWRRPADLRRLTQVGRLALARALAPRRAAPRAPAIAERLRAPGGSRPLPRRALGGAEGEPRRGGVAGRPEGQALGKARDEARQRCRVLPQRAPPGPAPGRHL